MRAELEEQYSVDIVAEPELRLRSMGHGFALDRGAEDLAGDKGHVKTVGAVEPGTEQTEDADQLHDLLGRSDSLQLYRALAKKNAIFVQMSFFFLAKKAVVLPPIPF